MIVRCRSQTDHHEESKQEAASLHVISIYWIQHPMDQPCRVRPEMWEGSLLRHNPPVQQGPPPHEEACSGEKWQDENQGIEHILTLLEKMRKDYTLRRLTLNVALTVTIEVISEIDKLDYKKSNGEDVGQQECRDGHRELGVAERNFFNSAHISTICSNWILTVRDLQLRVLCNPRHRRKQWTK